MTRALRCNSGLAEKLEIRRKLLATLSFPISIMETHAGYGPIARALEYDKASLWMPIDIDKQHPHAIHCDSREALRSIDLNAYNFFDIDAYGSPLEWAWIVSQRRTAASPFALALTCGAFAGAHRANRTYQSAGFSRQMLEALDADPETWFAGVYNEDLTIRLFRQCLTKWFILYRLVDLFWSPGFKKGTSKDLTAYYIGARFENRTTPLP